MLAVIFLFKIDIVALILTFLLVIQVNLAIYIIIFSTQVLPYLYASDIEDQCFEAS